MEVCVLNVFSSSSSSLVDTCVLQYEAKSRLERFTGSSAISSADLFDDPKKQTGKEMVACA